MKTCNTQEVKYIYFHVVILIKINTYWIKKLMYKLIICKYNLKKNNFGRH